jgi:hypothetical protein
MFSADKYDSTFRGACGDSGNKVIFCLSKGVHVVTDQRCGKEITDAGVHAFLYECRFNCSK